MFSQLSQVAIAIVLSAAALNLQIHNAQAASLGLISPSSTVNTSTTPAELNLIDESAPQAIAAANSTTAPSSAEVSFATYLTQANVKVYGAYNCPFTLLQRQLFGEAAFQQLDYIECKANGKNAQPSLCQGLQIQQTPTWEINGHLYTGVRSLAQLARLTKYQGATNFQQAGISGVTSSLNDKLD